MADYVTSLRRIIEAPYRIYHPGHGGPIACGPEFARALLAHRELRNHQILDEARRAPRTIGELLAAIYPTLSPALRLAARMTLRAHIEYLVDIGALAAERSWSGRLRVRALV
jgi:glyoxylase-like metal-dependent hydrolase (beta-lactamase superfamily II)